jgi:threonine aldolase
MLENDVWLHHADHANAMARALSAKIATCSGAELVLPTEANGVFVNLPDPVITRLKDLGWVFYTFIGGSARFMCSWATTMQAVDALATDIGSALSALK